MEKIRNPRVKIYKKSTTVEWLNRDGLFMGTAIHVTNILLPLHPAKLGTDNISEGQITYFWVPGPFGIHTADVVSESRPSLFLNIAII